LRQVEGGVDRVGEGCGGGGVDGDAQDDLVAEGVVAHFEVEGVVEAPLLVLG
jgi:hypothetical protein